MEKPRDIAVEVVDLGKSYGAVRALKSIGFSIESGRYCALLGPSGGGKTTLLRLIGGFIRPDSGRVLLHGHDVSHLPPNQRPTSMVFQNYALFPHMTVARNVAYGLRLLRLPTREIRERVDEMLAMVGLADYDARMPHELSGGQQQRVQLARSLVLGRDILLLDEPLASLDAKLRKDMCLELKRLQEKVGITFIHVTHNQEEALTVADHIAIIADGDLVEQGTAKEVYETPEKRFTAGFVGENNVFDGIVSDAVAASPGMTVVEVDFARLEVGSRSASPVPGDAVAISVRSELLDIFPPDRPAREGWQLFPATYLDAVYLGWTISHIVRLGNGTEIVVRTMADRRDNDGYESGQAVNIGWPSARACLHLS